MQGKKNIYLCGYCGHGIVTVDRDAGTTPFMVPCDQPDCRGFAQSLFYGAPQEILSSITPAYEWYAPTADELATKSEATQEHCRNGGLLMRPFTKETAATAEPSSCP